MCWNARVAQGENIQRMNSFKAGDGDGALDVDTSVGGMSHV
jgi:hypothetical protein